MNTLLLSKNTIEELLNTEETLQTVETVYRAHGLGNAIVPSKISLDLGRAGQEGWMNSMPAYVVNADAAGIKFAGGFVHNPERQNLPYVMATIVLVDPRTGSPLAIMDGSYITVVRTGAAPAVAAKYLVKNPRVVAIIGAGAVGRAAIKAFDKTFSLEEIRLNDISKTACDKALTSLEGKIRTRLVVAADAEDCVKGADIVVTATHAKAPLFPSSAVKPGVVIFPLGSFQELDPPLVTEAAYRIVDHLDQNKHRGELKTYFESGFLSDADVYAEIGEIVAGKKPRPEIGDGFGIVSLIGVGSLDIALAKLLFDRARKAGLGTQFTF